jgi:gluconolactonase
LLAAKGVAVAGAAGVQNYEAEGGTLWNKKFVTPEIPGVVKGGTLVSVVREGFQGTEGPVVLKDGSILFTENRADRIVKIAANGDISTYLEKTGGANALAVAADGALYGVLTAAGATGVVQFEPARRSSPLGRRARLLCGPMTLPVRRRAISMCPTPAPIEGDAGGYATGPVKTGLYWVNPKGKSRWPMTSPSQWRGAQRG